MRRLVTTVRLSGSPGVSVSLMHELELDDGRRVLLLDDRGFASSGTWEQVTREDVEHDARTCVGPDEPFGDRTADDMARDHWAALAARAGVPASALPALPHDVELHPGVEALLARPGLAPRPLDAAYLHALLREVARLLVAEQGDPAPAVHLAADARGLVVVMRAAGRHLEVGLTDRVDAYVPDGHDPSSHAEHLAQAFDEDADRGSGRPPGG